MNEERESTDVQKILSIDIGGSKLLTSLVDVTVDEEGVRRAALSGVSKRTLNK